MQMLGEQNNLILSAETGRVQVISDHGGHDLGLAPVHHRGL